MLKFKMNFKTFLIYFYLLSIPLYALDITEHNSSVELLPFSQFYIDKSNKLSVEEIKKREFSNIKKEIFSFGFHPNQALWVKFKLRNQTDKPLRKIIEYANPLTEDVIFFDKTEQIVEGSWHISNSRESINPAFTIKLNPYEERTFYIKAHSTISTVIIQLRLWNSKDFNHYTTKHLMFIVLFFAIMGTLLIYNLFIYLFTNDKAYLYYLFYLIAIILNELTYSGVAQYYFLSPELSKIVTEYIMLLIAFMIVTIVLFTREFLNTKHFPLFDSLLKSTLYGVPILSLLSCNNFLFTSNIIIVFLPIGALILFIAFYLLYHGVKEAQFYVFGWSLVVVALLITNLQTLGIMDINHIVKYINDFAFTAEAFLFSIALAHRIKINNNKIIEMQQSEQQRLQTLVTQKTHDLQISLNKELLLHKELNHRVKNNFQMILSLIKLQTLKSDNESLKKLLSTIENRIYSISYLYSLLQIQNREIDTKTYFQSIISHIQYGFEKEVKIVYNINYNLPIDELVYCGLILNELVTNSFKYAFDSRGGELIVSLEIFDNSINFTIQDNGSKPISSSKSSNTLGLLIIQTLVEEHLGGEFKFTYNRGVKNIIRWKI
ncbi:Sensory transduction histidine kinase [hydrothermal vent metagenome]|uniref:histidine kinase n=1 Tax=hydrothermal vent metagenome TaxID=652676 RepID=A0A1W1CZZ0_9ZZZZ